MDKRVEKTMVCNWSLLRFIGRSEEVKIQPSSYNINVSHGDFLHFRELQIKSQCQSKQAPTKTNCVKIERVEQNETTVDEVLRNS